MLRTGWSHKVGRGILLISKIREEYPHRMMLSDTVVSHSRPPSQFTNWWRMLMNVVLNKKALYDLFLDPKAQYSKRSI
jgi:hypothetical protein